MIIWLNGTFGCGKTSTAAELHPLVPSSRVFDPETVGYMLQPNLADHPISDFQHWPPWRPLVVVVLDAAEEVLRQRIQGSAEAQAWRLDHLAEYRSSRAWMIQAADLAVNTSRRTSAEIAHQIAGALPRSLRISSP